MKNGKMGLFRGLEGHFQGQNWSSKEFYGWPGPTGITFSVGHRLPGLRTEGARKGILEKRNDRINKVLRQKD